MMLCPFPVFPAAFATATTLKPTVVLSQSAAEFRLCAFRFPHRIRHFRWGCLRCFHSA